MGQHILLEELYDEGQGHKVQLWKLLYQVLNVLFFVLDPLVMKKLLVGFEQDYRLLEVTEEALY